MNLEKEKEIKKLISIQHPNENQELLYARFLGMSISMLTNEQADTMISYLEKWIGEKNA
jgi:hypothetical protein